VEAASHKRIGIANTQLHPGQLKVLREARRFNVLDCGRRWGKSELGMHLSAQTLSRGYPVGWFAPTYKILAPAWEEITRSLKGSSIRSNRTERILELPGGGVIEGWTLEDDDAGRSRKYKRVIVDEAAKAPHFKTQWERAIRPTLTDFEGDAWFLSTPMGRNYFWQLYQLGQDDTQDIYKSWQQPSSNNPHLPPKEIEQARKELPQAVFAQEYLAEFLENEGAVFRNIDACMGAPTADPADHKGHNILAGVDWGKHNDFTCISVGCTHCMRELYLDRFNKIDYAFQRGRLAEVVRKWSVGFVLAESNAMGEPIIEQLQRDGLPVQGFTTTAESKPPLIENLALVFERAQWQFLPDAVAKGELEAYERRVSGNTGRSTYSAPEGLHDDTVIARALMVRAWTDQPRILFGV
jgi:terminase large subunit-like protein